MILIVEPAHEDAQTLREHVGVPATALADVALVQGYIDTHAPADAVVVGPSVDQDEALSLAERLRVSHPSTGVVLVRSKIDAQLLTRALQAGVREVVGDEGTQLSQAVNRALEIAAAMRQQLGQNDDAQDRRGRIVTVFSAKGGCGKTTLATNLAVTIAAHGRRTVCLVDLDLAFGDVAIVLQLFPSHTIADTVRMGNRLDSAGLSSLLTQHSPGVMALAAPLEPSVADTITAGTITRVLDLLSMNFDYVLVDTPPAFTDQVLAAFDLSDVLVLLATLDIPALKNLKLTLETLQLLNYPLEKWQIVLNRADSKVGLAVAEVEKSLQLSVACQIPSSRAVPASVNRGVPLVTEDPKHPVSAAIRAFAEAHILQPSAGRPIPSQLRGEAPSRLRRRKARTA
jgi:pilus assembly protein CpaE